RPAGGGRDPGVAPVGRGGPRGRGVGRPPAGRGMRQDHAGVQGQGGAAEAQLDRRDVPGRRGGERGPRRRDRGRSGAHPRLVRWQGPGGRRQPGGRPGPGRRVHIEGGENYKLDKADAVLSRCGPHVSRRGGVWMVKWLNHVSTVRMKQNRHLEALEMLYDLELYSPYSPEEAPEFFETLYRNLAWAHKALGQIDEAVVYFERMARSSKAHKGSMDWFDCWDIGKLAATRGYRDKDMPQFYKGRALVERALDMHQEAEPEDLVMRAKVHDSLAECYIWEPILPGRPASVQNVSNTPPTLVASGRITSASKRFFSDGA
ncbi:unnamed protein product, partial [Prorocentrum cordatum]